MVYTNAYIDENLSVFIFNAGFILTADKNNYSFYNVLKNLSIFINSKTDCI